MDESKPRRRLHFKSVEESVEFFETHDMSNYFDEMPEVEFDIELEPSRHLVAIDAELADRITAIAKAKHITSQQLIEQWLNEKVYTEG